ncbi:MAG: purine-binding chemotaxis protein CheW [Spirochaetales bacterium]|nr:purine-binding chemotaxis protein CheW [Spirochaetales bacterium]
MDYTRQFVSFYLDERLFGIDIRFVNEVNPNVKIVPIPLASPHIRGHVNIRGQVVLIMDVLLVFKTGRVELADETQIIILKTFQDLARVKNIENEIDPSLFPDKPVGFLADSVGDVITVNADRIETPTQFLEKSYSVFLEGMVKLDNNLLTILNPAKIFNYRQEMH